MFYIHTPKFKEFTGKAFTSIGQIVQKFYD
jgi:hypothetical protein